MRSVDRSRLVLEQLSPGRRRAAELEQARFEAFCDAHHLPVEHGAVTLTGVVVSEVERRTAEAISRLTVGVMSVKNKLDVEIDRD